MDQVERRDAEACPAACVGEEHFSIHALSLMEGGEVLGLRDFGVDAVEVTARGIPDIIRIPADTR